MKIKYRSYEDALSNRINTHDIDCQSVIEHDDENLCEQSHKADCDINTIIRRYEVTGQLDPFITRHGGVYGDFTQYQDYQENMNMVITAQEAFQALNAEVRKKFDNDPAKLMQFLDDNKNYDEAVKLGLVEPKIQESETPNTGKKTTKTPQKPSGKNVNPSDETSDT